MVGDEAAGGGFPDPRLGNLRIIGEIEVLEIIAVLEAGGVDAAGDALPFVAAQLIVEEDGEELQGVQPPFRGRCSGSI
jgi:hypothetical protein